MIEKTIQVSSFTLENPQFLSSYPRLEERRGQEEGRTGQEMDGVQHKVKSRPQGGARIWNLKGAALSVVHFLCTCVRSCSVSRLFALTNICLHRQIVTILFLVTSG